jgi:hypothetical protein
MTTDASSTTLEPTTAPSRPATRDARPASQLTDFCAAFPRLDAAQQERFRLTVTRLLAGHVLMPGTAFRPDADWTFVDRFGDLIESYLRLGGWHLEIDRRLGVARVVHEGGEQRVRLGKLESLTLRVLRLVYHEQKLVLGEDDRCRLTVGDLRERLIHAGLSPLDVSKRKLALAVRALDRYHLVAVERGFMGDDEEMITVSPVIEKVLSPDRIEQDFRAVQAAQAARAARAGQGGEDGETDDEDLEPEADGREGEDDDA